MTPNEFYKQLATVKEAERITLGPGPLVMVVGWQDALSARLMLWLIDNMPAESTQGDLEDVLGNALWWARFWAMLHYAEKPQAAQAALWEDQTDGN